MKLTKYEHACFTVEKDNLLLVVDPGIFTTDFIVPENIAAIIITHEHQDHFDSEQIAAIMDKNPDALILAHETITSKIQVFQTHAVTAGDVFTIGSFTLEFFGGEHALIHPSIPRIVNLGVMINDLLYYPGDSFVLPQKAVDTLAIPTSAPWLKMSEAMDFLVAIQPRFAFATHDALLSSSGKAISDRLLGGIAEKNGIEYSRLELPVDV